MGFWPLRSGPSRTAQFRGTRSLQRFRRQRTHPSARLTTIVTRSPRSLRFRAQELPLPSLSPLTSLGSQVAQSPHSAPRMRGTPPRLPSGPYLGLRHSRTPRLRRTPFAASAVWEAESCGASVLRSARAPGLWRALRSARARGSGSAGSRRIRGLCSPGWILWCGRRPHRRTYV